MTTAIVIIVIVAVVVAIVLLQIAARQQTQFTCERPRQEVVNIIHGYFGVMWTSVSGPGTFNYRPKLKMYAPTISITAASRTAGGCDVSIWTSDYRARYGLMFHGGAMVRKKRGLAKRVLAESTSPDSRGLAH
jgi:hypothetical protein